MPTIKILTIGDGDLSYSLALSRCYNNNNNNNNIHITATTYPSRQELFATYTNAESNLLKLQSAGHTVLHSINGIHLTEETFPSTQTPFDHIIFNHPHLGLNDLHETTVHARRHQVLIAHYLSNVSTFAAVGCHIHLGLCGRQPLNWKVEAAAERTGRLELIHILPATRFEALSVGSLKHVQRNALQVEWQARKRFRHLHVLGNFGYEHRRTHGDADIGGSGNSVDMVWKVTKQETSSNTTSSNTTSSNTTSSNTTSSNTTSSNAMKPYCPICDIKWNSMSSLTSHVSLSSSPDPTFKSTEEMKNARRMQVQEKVTSKPQVTSSALQCTYCKQVFPSRNQLFKHLKDCTDVPVDPSTVDENSNNDTSIEIMEKIMLTVGYVGTTFYGSKYSGSKDEIEHPTVEGAVILAVKEVYLNSTYLLPLPFSSLSSSSSSSSSLHSSLSSSSPLCSITIGSGIGTERNAHCIDNIMCVNIRFRCERIHKRAFLETENVRYEQIIQALEKRNVFVTSKPRRYIAPSYKTTTTTNSMEEKDKESKTFSRQRKRQKRTTSVVSLFEDMRHVVQSVTYSVAIPYKSVITEEDQVLVKNEKNCFGIWLSGFPPECDTDTTSLLTLLQSVKGSENISIEIQLAACGGNANVWFSQSSTFTSTSTSTSTSTFTSASNSFINTFITSCISTLNGASFLNDTTLVAMNIEEAQMKMSVHKRIKRVLKRLCVGPSGRKKGNKNPARSFHNFTSAKKYAKSDAMSMRKSLMRCASNFQEDIIPSNDASSGSQNTTQNWMQSHWFVVHFSAVSFLPEQVRRMAAVLREVVGGREKMEYIDAAFKIDGRIKTPIINSSSNWLASVKLKNEAETYHQEMLREDGHKRLHAIRKHVLNNLEQ